MSFHIVDSRGRLFGRINLIDLAVLIGLLLIGVEGYRLLFEKRNPPVQVQKESRTVWVTIEIQNKPLWFSRAIAVGDKEIDDKDIPIGIILRKETSPVTSIASGPGGKPHLINNPNREDIILKLELKAIAVKGDLLFKNFKLKIGNRIVMETNTISLEGVITHVQSDKADS